MSVYNHIYLTTLTCVWYQFQKNTSIWNRVFSPSCEQHAALLQRRGCFHFADGELWAKRLSPKPAAAAPELRLIYNSQENCKSPESRASILNQRAIGYVPGENTSSGHQPREQAVVTVRGERNQDWQTCACGKTTFTSESMSRKRYTTVLSFGKNAIINLKGEAGDMLYICFGYYQLMRGKDQIQKCISQSLNVSRLPVRRCLSASSRFVSTWDLNV